MSEQIIQLKIGPKVTEWILTNHGEGVRSLRPKEIATVTAQAEEKARVFSWNRRTGAVNRWHGEVAAEPLPVKP